jgi:hypothetical protein
MAFTANMFFLSFNTNSITRWNGHPRWQGSVSCVRNVLGLLWGNECRLPFPCNVHGTRVFLRSCPGHTRTRRRWCVVAFGSVRLQFSLSEITIGCWMHALMMSNRDHIHTRVSWHSRRNLRACSVVALNTRFDCLFDMYANNTMVLSISRHFMFCAY